MPTRHTPRPERNIAKLGDEQGRQAALNRYDVLDTAPEQRFDSITEIVRDLLDVPICAVSLIDCDRQWFKSISGLNAEETPRNIAFCDHTIRGRAVLVVPDATRDLRFSRNPLVTGDPYVRSYVGAPLVTPDGYNLGALCAIDTRPRDFAEPQKVLLERFARLVIDQLELCTIAHHDFLTGVPSRRAFIASVHQALCQRTRTLEPMALLMVDIDHFKTINDRFGHAAGDAVIKQVAKECEGLLRPVDCIGRLGGEEFGILLRDADRATAMACAERMRQAIAALPPIGGAPVTASFGVATVLDVGDVAAWLLAADDALYVAKRGGRNRCVLSSAVAAQAA